MKNNLPTVMFSSILLIILAGVIVAIVNPSSPGFTVSKTSTDMAFDEERQPVVGDLDAPNTITVFNDYQCPACKAWDEEIFPILKEDFVNEGDAKIQFVNFPFLNDGSYQSALAFEIVHEYDPEISTDFHMTLLENQDGMTIDRIGELGEEYTSFSSGEFVDLIIEQEHMDEVLSDKQRGEELGVGGTPTVFVNEVMVENSGDIEEIISHFE